MYPSSDFREQFMAATRELGRLAGMDKFAVEHPHRTALLNARLSPDHELLFGCYREVGGEAEQRGIRRAA